MDKKVEEVLALAAKLAKMICDRKRFTRDELQAMSRLQGVLAKKSNS